MLSRVPPMSSQPIRLGLHMAAPLVALALATRSFLAVDGAELQPDAEQYLFLAETFGWGSLWGGAREPLWPALLAGPVAVAGPEPTTLRAAGLIFFPLLVFAFQRLTALVLPLTWAVAGGLALSASPWLRVQSLEGLREVPAAAGLLLLLAELVRRQGRYDTASGIAFGIAAGALALLRWDTLLVTAPLLLLSAALRRATARSAVSAIAVVAGVTSPLTLGNLDRYEDPMYHSNIHAVFFRNHEFVGQPGYPTLAEIKVDGYTGPPTTWASYLFTDHTVAEVARRTARGGPMAVIETSYVGVTGSFRPTDRGLRPHLEAAELLPWGLLIGSASGFVLLARRRQWHLAAAVPLIVFQLAPVQQQMDTRLGLTILPTTLLCLLMTAHSTHAALGARRSSAARRDDLPLTAD